MTRSSINFKYLDSFAKELSSKFRRINHLTTTGRTAIGNYHEEILKVALQNFLSKKILDKNRLYLLRRSEYQQSN